MDELPPAQEHWVPGAVTEPAAADTRALLSYTIRSPDPG